MKRAEDAKERAEEQLVEAERLRQIGELYF
jgi:hypothetical protein